MIYGWSPRIGDPGVLGWATVAGYLLAGVLCLQAYLRGASEGRVWLALALLMLALAINKQLDLQSLLTAVARHSAQKQGWYGQRRAVQLGFVLTAAAIGGAVGWAVARRLRSRGGPIRLAGLGSVVLLAFIVVRAASFHHADAALMSGAGAVRLNHLLELGGIALIAVAAGRARRR